MKYAFFPGCVSRGGCPELYPATIKVCERLGLELDGLDKRGATCTGAGGAAGEEPVFGRRVQRKDFCVGGAA